MTEKELKEKLVELSDRVDTLESTCVLLVYMVDPEGYKISEAAAVLEARGLNGAGFDQ